MLTAMPVYTILQETDPTVLIDSYHAAGINDLGTAVFHRFQFDSGIRTFDFEYRGNLANVTPRDDQLVGETRGGFPEVSYLDVTNDGVFFGRARDDSGSVIGRWTNPSNFAAVSFRLDGEFRLSPLESGATVNNQEVVAAIGHLTPTGSDDGIMVLAKSSGEFVEIQDIDDDDVFIPQVLGIGDDGSVLVGVLGGKGTRYDEIWRFSADLQSKLVIADRDRFASIDAASLSDDGRVVALIGILDAGQPTSEQLGKATGKRAIYGGAIKNNMIDLHRVIGESGDGVLDAHETWIDLGATDVAAGSYMNYHDTLGVTLVVQSELDASGLGTFQVAYKTHPAAEDIDPPQSLSHGHLFRTDVLIDDPNGSPEFLVATPQVVVLTERAAGLGPIPGSAIDYQSKTATGVRLWDMNREGEILAEVKLKDRNGKEFEAMTKVELVNRPVLLVPGIGGAFLKDPRTYDGPDGWYSNLGFNPEGLLNDPIAGTYATIAAALQEAGYVEGQDLFEAPYDWRLLAGPIDNVRDGVISGLTASGISSGNKTGDFAYGVDYLGYWLRKAQTRWEQDHGVPLDTVDVVAHSTGGLVTRTYIQSTAYRGDIGGGKKLPGVSAFVMMAVPNDGAPKAWSFVNDDWFIDFFGLPPDPTYPVVFRSIVHQAFLKVLAGNAIHNKTGNITLETLLAGEGVTPEEFRSEYAIVRLPGTPDTDLVIRVRKRFIQVYAPQIQGLVATYPFIERNGGLEAPRSDEFPNELLLDLNSTAGTSAFTDPDNVDVVFNLYGNQQPTIVAQREQTGNLIPIPFADLPVQHFDDTKIPFFPERGEVYYEPLRQNAGDGTVPRQSLIQGGRLLDNHDVIVHEYFPEGTAVSRSGQSFAVGGELNHTGYLSNPAVVQDLIEALGVTLAVADVEDQRDLAVGQIWQLINDPVNGMLVDSQGRRLGVDADGQVYREIAGGEYYGGQDGYGYVVTQDPLPLKLQIVGAGEPFFVAVNRQLGDEKNGFTVAGELQAGQRLLFDMPTSIAGLQASDEHVTTPQEMPIAISILANDVSDAGLLEPGSITLDEAAKGGTVRIDPDTGIATYEPRAGFSGIDAFSYTVRDTEGNLSNPATVTIDVVDGSRVPIPSARILRSPLDAQPYVIPADTLTSAILFQALSDTVVSVSPEISLSETITMVDDDLLPVGGYIDGLFTVQVEAERTYAIVFAPMGTRRGYRITSSAGHEALSAAPPTNILQPTDVNGDSETTSLDALRVINRLAREGGSESQVGAVWEGFYNTNRDPRVSSLDALVVINQLSRIATMEGEADVGLPGSSHDDRSPSTVDAVISTELRRDARRPSASVLDAVVSANFRQSLLVDSAVPDAGRRRSSSLEREEVDAAIGELESVDNVETLLDDKTAL